MIIGFILSCYNDTCFLISGEVCWAYGSQRDVMLKEKKNGRKSYCGYSVLQLRSVSWFHPIRGKEKIFA